MKFVWIAICAVGLSGCVSLQEQINDSFCRNEAKKKTMTYAQCQKKFAEQRRNAGPAPSYFGGSWQIDQMNSQMNRQIMMQTQIMRTR
jgi:hypothetical protein